MHASHKTDHYTSHNGVQNAGYYAKTCIATYNGQYDSNTFAYICNYVTNWVDVVSIGKTNHSWWGVSSPVPGLTLTFLPANIFQN